MADRAPFWFLLLFAASLTALARPLRADDGTDAISCAVPGVSEEARVAVLPKEFGSPPALAALNGDILRHRRADAEFAERTGDILTTLRGGRCGEVSAAYDRMSAAADGAFSKRVKEETAIYGEGAVRWKPARVSRKTSAPTAADPDGFAGACAVPANPPAVDVPVVPRASSSPEREVLTALAADAAAFNAALSRQHSLLAEQLPLERAYDCREVLVAYRDLVAAELDAFGARRDHALASIVERALRPASRP